jgi:uncharacterized protein
MYLLDTNIFLEILLDQKKKKICKQFIIENSGRLNISDFSLFSIAIVLFKGKAYDEYSNFQISVTKNMNVLSMPIEEHNQIIETGKTINLDFDDAYQYSIAKFFDLKIVTMDKDFKKVKDIEILFL